MERRQGSKKGEEIDRLGGGGREGVVVGKLGGYAHIHTHTQMHMHTHIHRCTHTGT